MKGRRRDGWPGWLLRRFTLVGLALIVILFAVKENGERRSASAAVPPSARLGVNFVSAPGQTFSNQSQRFDWAASAGVTWNRWAMYWSNIEPTCNGSFDWSGVDPTVNADGANGVSDDAILLATPGCYATTYSAQSLPPLTGSTRPGMHTLSGNTTQAPVGLYSSTFADGTDTWAPGKAINPSNPWARFVSAAVTRYQGQIHYWEIWNEPDYSAFWTGSQRDYARLLKVAWLAAHAADPSATILVGGMMYWQWTNQYGTDQAWLKQFLPILTADPTAAANDDYFEVLPYHFYSRSTDAYTRIQSAASVLASYGLRKEIWLNETNAPACNDQSSLGRYVNCADYGTASNGAVGYASDTEQAAFIIQAAAFAFAGGAKRVFEFQLQDDGNTQALGLFRNDGSGRPSYTAEQLVAQYLAGFTTAKRLVANGVETITFGVAGPIPRRVTVLFNDTGSTATGTVTAAGVAPTSVSLIQQDGTQQSLAAASSYRIVLPAATDNRNYDVPANPNDYLIGGQTMFLVENLPPDTVPPVSAVTSASLTQSPLAVRLAWSGSDSNGWGVMDYTVQVRDLTAGGSWVNWWTNTTSTVGTFIPLAGHQYQFRSLARDWAGNVESKCATQADLALNAQAASFSAAANQSPPPYRYYFPVVPQRAASC